MYNILMMTTLRHRSYSDSVHICIIAVSITTGSFQSHPHFRRKQRRYSLINTPLSSSKSGRLSALDSAVSGW